MPRIFISYRRADSEIIVGRIYDRLVMAFGEQYVFKDLERIPPGQDFRDVIRGYVNTCDVMLAIIGPQWLTVAESDGTRRIDNPNDFVRFEVSEALLRDNVLVIPTYVMHARPVTVDALPESLHKLAFNNGTSIRNDPDFNTDINKLIEYLREYDQTRRAGRTTAGVFPPSQQLNAAQLQPAMQQQQTSYTPMPTPQPVQRPSGGGVPLAWVIGGGAVLLVLALVIGVRLAGSGDGGSDSESDGGNTTSNLQNGSSTLPILGTRISFTYPDNWVLQNASDGPYIATSNTTIAEAQSNAQFGYYALSSQGALVQISDLARQNQVGATDAQGWAFYYQAALSQVGIFATGPVRSTYGDKTGYEIGFTDGSGLTTIFFYDVSSSTTLAFFTISNGGDFGDEIETIIDSVTVG